MNSQELKGYFGSLPCVCGDLNITTTEWRTFMETRRHFLARSAAILGGLTVPTIPFLAGLSRPEASCAVDLDHERARVAGELQLFRDVYLPVLRAPYFLAHEAGTPRLIPWPWPAQPRCRSDWQAATQRLLDALGRQDGSQVIALDAAEFAPLFAGSPFSAACLLQTPDQPCYSVRAGRLYWAIYPSSPFAQDADGRTREIWRSLFGVVPGLPQPAAVADTTAQLRRYLTAIETWYLEELPVTGRLRAFEYVLPLLAEFLPALPVQALDRQRMKTRVRHHAGLRSEERAECLRGIDRCLFSGCLSTSSAWVMETLANNNFGDIRDLLELPEIYGSWNAFMPKFIFAVLYRKILVLREMATIPGSPLLHQDRAGMTLPNTEHVVARGQSLGESSLA
jgi:hypothetical protein